MTTIEVEKKFQITPDIETKLQSLEATLLCEKSFVDVYYDTIENKMTLSDHWLRKRNETWELKSPPKSKQLSTSTQYTETTSVQSIISIVLSLLILSPETSPEIDNVEELITLGKLQPLASFKTTRKSYRIKDCEIDIDIADFGYSVGEIEKVVTSEEMVKDALEDIDKLAVQLGITSIERVPGKLDTYLKQKNPDLHHKLVENCILCG